MKLQALKLQVFKRRLQHKCFPVEFAKTFKNTYFEEYLQKTASGVL